MDERVNDFNDYLKTLRRGILTELDAVERLMISRGIPIERTAEIRKQIKDEQSRSVLPVDDPVPS